MQAQHINDMEWNTAPGWATHIIGWIGEPQSCYWAEKIDDRFFSAETREAKQFSFGLADADDDEDDYGWEVVAERPNTGICPK